METNLTALDLFCGVGGFSLGFQQAGVKILAGFDFWDKAVENYNKNFNDHKSHILDLSDDACIDTLKAYSPDIIIGGPPCQDFSCAGLQDESRGKALLSIKYARITAQIKPKYFVMENVKSISAFETFKDTCAIFEDAGYTLCKLVLDAAYFGVPQYRKRMFVIGGFGLNVIRLENIIKSYMSVRPLSLYEYLNGDIDVKYYYRKPPVSNFKRSIFSVHEPSLTVTGYSGGLKPKGYVPIDVDKPFYTEDVKELPMSIIKQIQTFPYDYIIDGNKKDVNQMIGNSVPVNLSKNIAKSLITYISNI